MRAVVWIDVARKGSSNKLKYIAPVEKFHFVPFCAFVCAFRYFFFLSIRYCQEIFLVEKKNIKSRDIMMSHEELKRTGRTCVWRSLGEINNLDEYIIPAVSSNYRTSHAGRKPLFFLYKCESWESWEGNFVLNGENICLIRRTVSNINRLC